jgi:transposase InsO family protein
MVARTFVDGWVSRFGSPIQVITDQGSQYESELFSELCKRLGIDKVRTSGYHPQCQGGIEVPPDSERTHSQGGSG